MNDKAELFCVRRTQFIILGILWFQDDLFRHFSSNVCIFCAILNDVTSHMRKDYHTPQGFRCGVSKSEHLKTTSWFIVYFVCSWTRLWIAVALGCLPWKQLCFIGCSLMWLVQVAQGLARFRELKFIGLNVRRGLPNRAKGVIVISLANIYMGLNWLM